VFDELSKGRRALLCETFFSTTMTMDRLDMLTKPPGNIPQMTGEVVTMQGLYRKNLAA
jgi:hypothetical protein